MNIFEKAAKSVPGHLYKGEYADGNGNYCTAGHVYKAAGFADEAIDDADLSEPKFLVPAWEILNDVATSMFPERAEHWKYISTVNDHPDTTEDDVIAILEKSGTIWAERGLDKTEPPVV